MSTLITPLALGEPGSTIAIKDSIDIAGMQTQAGSRALADAEPAREHAEVVQRLLDAGWNIIGKANMHELAFGVTGINDWTGTAENPQDILRVPGGSSSGSAAAVGSGLCDAALGTDTGGSVRIPAACCGVIGLKPTFGRVSRVGVYPEHSTLDCVGPFARSMTMIRACMAAISPTFDFASSANTPSQPRVKIITVDADAEVVAGVRNAILATDWSVSEAELPGLEAAFHAGLAIINVETWAAFGHLTGRDKLGADVEARLLNAGKTTAAAVDAAEDIRRTFTAAVDAALTDVDVLVLPTMPCLPPLIADVLAGQPVISMTSLVRPFNLSGHPALSIPVPVDGTSVKTAVQIVGRKGEDERLCALGEMLEHAIRNIVKI